MENGIKILSMPFSIDVESMPISVQMEFIELRNDLDLKAKFLSKTLLELYKECFPRTRFPKISKRASKLICLFGSTYLCEQFFSKMKYCTCMSKCRIRISDAHLHDTLRIAASSMESNITTIMQQKKQFHKSHCKHVSEQRK